VPVAYDSNNRLRADNLSCLRGELLLFDALRFEAGAGQLLQVEGPNGSGKTSLLRILAGLTLPEDGTVLWNETPIRRQRAAYAMALHYIGHQPALKSGLSVVENLRFSCGIMGGRDISTALRTLGIHAQAHQPAHTLSAGQQRRTALARLLLRPAPLWILDEPYTALDTAGIAMINKLLTAHINAGGTAILTSHQSLDLPGLPLQRLRLGT
jgi:heme exporter protein A